MGQGSGARLTPVEYAKKLLQELNIISAPIYPRKIAKELGIYVWEREADGNYDGYLISANDSWGIMVNSAIKSKTRKRFTVAHELGHYCIGYHEGINYRCFGKDLETLSSTARQDEREANEFAVELLMPDELFKEDIRQRDISLDTINYLADKYVTSITSTNIRYARCSDHDCAIIVSEHGRIKYFAYSESFGKSRHLYLMKNAPLQNDCYAKKLFDAEFSILERHGQVPARAWSPNTAQPEKMLMEHSRCIPAFNQVISLIWFEPKKNGKSESIAHVLIQ